MMKVESLFDKPLSLVYNEHDVSHVRQTAIVMEVSHASR